MKVLIAIPPSQYNAFRAGESVELDHAGSDDRIRVECDPDELEVLVRDGISLGGGSGFKVRYLDPKDPNNRFQKG